MNCEEAQRNLSLYVDDRLPTSVWADCHQHLSDCPACTIELAEMRAVVRRLGALERPVPPVDLAARINRLMGIERATQFNQVLLSPYKQFEQWLAPRLMPYLIGALASLVLFVTAYGVLRPHFVMLRELASASRADSEADAEGFDINQPISLEGYVASRTAYAAESPSLNPHGALAALAWSPARGRAGDDDMIVVADVYSNGSASLAEIVQPPRNREMLSELQEALRQSPAFVPASLDRRPQTMRVVFVMQKVDVPEQGY